MKENYLYNRRQFFKKATHTALPILASVAVAPLLNGCYDPDFEAALISNDCHGGCESYCKDNCQGNCSGSCNSTCTNSCSGSAKSSTCTSCSNSCTGACDSSCTGGCSTNCSNSCKGSSASSNGCNDCTTTCASSCTTNCYSTCKNTCDNTCNTTCEGSNTGAMAEPQISSADGKISGYEYVDLGLSCKWARANYGSSNKPEKVGSRTKFATVERQQNVYTKLVSTYMRGGSISGTSYDFAKNEMGSNWRMPTKSDYEELINNCTVEGVTYNDVRGALFTSKKNGHTLFIPDTDSDLGIYWTADIESMGSSQSSVYLFAIQYGKKSGEYYLYSVGVLAYNGYGVIDGLNYLRAVSGGDPGNTGGNNGGGGSTGCNNSCSTSCGSRCVNQCTTECGGGCSSTCGGSCRSGCLGCIASCQSTANSGCGGGCYGTCSSHCENSCQGFCYSSCQFMGKYEG